MAAKGLLSHCEGIPMQPCALASDVRILEWQLVGKLNS